MVLSLKMLMLVEKSGQMGVPVISIPADMSVSKKEEIIVGFDRDRLAESLGIAL